MSDTDVFGLKLEIAVDPPVAPAGTSPGDVAVRLDVRLMGDAEAPQERLAVMVLGRPHGAWQSELQSALKSLVERASPAIQLLGPHEAEDAEGPDPTFDERLLEAMERFGAPGAEDRPARLLALVVDCGLEPPRYGLVDGLLSLGVALDVYCVGPSDHGHGFRLAAARGGGACVLDCSGPLDGLRTWATALDSWRVTEAVLVLRFTGPVHPLQTFRLDEEEVLALKPQRGQDTSMIIPLGPMGSARQEVSVLATLKTPGRQPGRYQLLGVELMWRDPTGRRRMSGAAIQRWSGVLATTHKSHAGVGEAVGRAALAAWVEEIDIAQRMGQPRKVSSVLDRMVQQLTSLDRVADADAVGALRIGYLRTGLLGVAQIGGLRRLAR